MKEKKALILAAGDGTRLRPLVGNHSKVLTPLFGVPILKRVILSAKEAGIENFFIVTGYKEGPLRQKIGDGKSLGVKIHYLKNHGWQRGNGTSALCAQNFFREPFVLLMGDHIFDPQTLKTLLTQQRLINSSESILVVDSQVKTFPDTREATKVQVTDGKITAIGKELKKFNGIDTGMFLCSPSIFNALEKAVKNKKYTLTDGLRILAKSAKLRSHTIRSRFWVDIDNPSDFRIAKKKILANLNNRNGGGLVSRFINRRVSRPISLFLAETPITPTQITLISFSMAIISSILFSQGGGDSNRIFAGFLAQFASIVDGCDGEVARLKFKSAPFGAWLDTILDRYADSLLIFGIFWGSFRTEPNLFFLTISFFAILGTFQTSYSVKEFELRFHRKVPSIPIHLPSGRDTRIFLIFLGALVNHLFIALLLIAILTNFNVWQRFWAVKKEETASQKQLAG